MSLVDMYDVAIRWIDEHPNATIDELRRSPLAEALTADELLDLATDPESLPRLREGLIVLREHARTLGVDRTQPVERSTARLGADRRCGKGRIRALHMMTDSASPSTEDERP